MHEGRDDRLTRLHELLLAQESLNRALFLQLVDARAQVVDLQCQFEGGEAAVLGEAVPEGFACVVEGRAEFGLEAFEVAAEECLAGRAAAAVRSACASAALRASWCCSASSSNA